MASLEGMAKMIARLGPKGRKGFMTITIIALFLFNLNGVLAAGDDNAWSGHASATALSPPLASISGFAWYDDNPTNGALDQGEDGLGGVTVDLYRDNGGDGVLDSNDTYLDTRTTATDGSYQFGDWSAGDYIIQVPETVTLGLTEYALTTDGSLPVSLEEGGDYSDANFGYEGLGQPTAVILSHFLASSTGGEDSPWPWLAALATLAASGALLIRRR